MNEPANVQGRVVINKCEYTGQERACVGYFLTADVGRNLRQRENKLITTES